ncbi:MAG: helix-turn-helix domain-containing protein [Candidatus Zhuqueibacterota bacterium]
MMKIFADDVVKIRLKMNLTQEEFARRVGVTLSTIHRWEKGKSLPSKLAIQRLVSLERNGIHHV